MGKTSKAVDQATIKQAGLPAEVLRDQYAGHGGSYIYDPASGTRAPAEQPINQQTEGQVNDE